MAVSLDCVRVFNPPDESPNASHRVREPTVHRAEEILGHARIDKGEGLKMQKMTQIAERLFPKARGKEVLISLIIVVLGLAGGVVTIGLILFAH
jgi:hypothetical protein